MPSLLASCPAVHSCPVSVQLPLPAPADWTGAGAVEAVTGAGAGAWVPVLPLSCQVLVVQGVAGGR